MKKLLLLPLIPLLFACSSSDKELATTTKPTTVTEIPEPVILAAVGDISCSPSQLESGDYPCADDKVAELIKYNNPDYFIPLGDLQYNTATYELLTTVYDPVWGFIKGRSIPVLGNHDYPAEGILSYFPELPTEGYYSKPLNEDWYVIVLNTNDDCQFVSCDSESEQYNWLIKTLDANPSKCAIVAMHHPRFSSGVHGNNDYLEPIWQVLISREVPIVLSGHDHNYERFNTNPAHNYNITQYVVGTGGKELRNVGPQQENSAFLSNDYHGALIINIVGDTLNTNFMSIDNRLIDQNQIECNK